jgi:hypothetical protein
MTAARVDVLSSEVFGSLDAEVSSALKAANKMTNKQLVSRVKSGFKKIREEAPYIIVLHIRFMALPRGSQNIDGCKTWGTFCSLKLHRSDRAIRYMLAQALGKGCTDPLREPSAAPQLAVVPDAAPAPATAEPTTTADQTVTQSAPESTEQSAAPEVTTAEPCKHTKWFLHVLHNFAPVADLDPAAIRAELSVREREQLQVMREWLDRLAA